MTSPALARLIALAKKRAEETKAKPVAPEQQVPLVQPTTISAALNNALSTTSDGITYNAKQQSIIDFAVSMRSCILIGAAGTGKTTTMRGVLTNLVQRCAHHIGTLNDVADHKHLKHASGAPGILIVSFTRRAVANIKKQLPADLQANCITIHAALEYGPVYEEVMDPVSCEFRMTRRFVAQRSPASLISHNIRVVVFEESSMIGTDLHKELMDALPAGVMEIYLGDIQQLPPVFGSAVLGYKMCSLPTVELTDVYRQALDSPIISLAHRILSGRGIPASELKAMAVPNKLDVRVIEKKLHADLITPRIAAFLCKQIEAGIIDFDDTTILVPFNKGLGSIELNKHIATYLARKEGATVYEIIAGFMKHYLRVGDRVLHNKEDAIVTRIVRNGSYAGKQYQLESPDLDYWGDNSKTGNVNYEDTIADVDALLEALALDKEERKAASSHIVTLQLANSGEEVELTSAAEINSLLLGYAMTVHKSQGSEFRKVYLILHNSHNTMLQRELLYTAVTRAREYLYIVCESDTFVKGVTKQRIPGNTLADKIEHFKGKVEREA